ncbi:SPW repeat-containing protein [Paramicrobacterium humi]|uniref:SPW repeat-containing protein n=1 Tax=Paramicrobacterium humi TaxID=640635 RepID=A0A1H4NFS5_9MICO|nr:SPW repeat protein [Microbacterium humi]SEB94120.1 SPW repeat-containing protein [Microbacterium humi]
MKRWTRWQDWVAVAAGLYAALATIWTVGTAASITLMIVLGVLMIIAGVWSVAVPKLVSMEWIVAVLGALLFISPWVAQYATHMGAAWTSWICGGVGVVTGLWALAPAMRMNHTTHGGTQMAH